MIRSKVSEWVQADTKRRRALLDIQAMCFSVDCAGAIVRMDIIDDQPTIIIVDGDDGEVRLSIEQTIKLMGVLDEKIQ